jgi:serine/threonine protein kinase/beta-lactam-binding protein with PASTA domain
MAKDAFIDGTFDNRYLILRKLGSGGMADVYLAEDQELGRRVALKLLNERHANDAQFVERFRREAQSAAGLNHPNIVSVFDRGQAEGTYYIAMEFLDGRTLKDLLVRNGPTPIPIAIDYARQILNALAFAHRNGIVHRDIKPHNIVVGGDGRLKVTDFGIARSGASQMTEAGSIVGTAQYLSPEQARGAPVDPRSDIYSLGIVLYEMLTGEVPFTGDAPVEIAMKHLSSIPKPPSNIRPEVSHDLDAVVLCALAKNPDQRYSSAEDMDADLGRIANGLGVSPRTEEAMTQVISGVGITTAATVITEPPRALAPSPPAPPAYRPPGPYYGYEERPRRRSPWPWLLGLLAVVIAAGAGYLLYHSIQSQLNNNKTVAVIDVGLEKQDLATQNLTAEGLQVTVKKEPSDSVPPGSVIRQDPGAGLKVARASIVTIFVSTGKKKVRVPAVKGFTLAQAVSTLADAGLKSNPVSIYNPATPNTVIAQDPPAGKNVVTDTVVRINISQGLKPIAVPSVVGQTFAAASTALTKAGFIVTRTDIDSLKPKGQVVDQSPAAGTNLTSGATIALSVSKGQTVKQIPDVTGQSQADAEALLKSVGFGSTVVTQDTADPSQDGIVQSQAPVGGTEGKKGAVVTLTVGKLVVVTQTTTTTTTTPAASPTPPPAGQ